MDAQMLEALLKAYLSEMRQRLDQAAGLARVAVACADAGDLDKAVEIALGVEQLVCEVNTFLNAVSLLQRILGAEPDAAILALNGHYCAPRFASAHERKTLSPSP